MLLKELYQGMYGKINEVDDDQMIPYKDKDGESQEMSAKAAKRMGKDHPAKQAYDAMVKDGDGGAKKKSVNIFDKPADEPKAQPSGDDERQIGGPNGLEISRDEIKNIIMKDPEIQDIIGGDDVYWDDAELVSSKFDDATVASIDPNKPMTIGDLKQAIKDFSEEQGAEQDDSDSIDGDFENIENDEDVNRMRQGMQQAIGGDDDPDRLVLLGKMKANNGEIIIVWKDTDKDNLMGVDSEGNVYKDGKKGRKSIGVSTAGSVFGENQNKQRKAENVSFREIKENWVKNNL